MKSTIVRYKVCILLPFFICIAGNLYAQQVSQKEFTKSAAFIARNTGNAYRLIRLGSNKSPSILTVNKSAGIGTIPELQRNDIAAVRNFALSQAQYIAAHVLILPESVQLAETGTQQTGNTWLSSYYISYNGIPLRERYLRLNIGALSGEVMLVRNNIPAKNPNTLSPTVTQDEVSENSKVILGIHSEMKSVPQLVFVDELENNSLYLCYEFTASDPDIDELWRMTFDAVTGKLVEKKSLLKHENCSSLKSPQNMGETVPLSLQDQVMSIPDNSKIPTPLSNISGRVLAKVTLMTPYDTLTTVGLPYALLNVNGKQVEADSDGFWSLSSASISYPVTITSSLKNNLFSVIRQDGPDAVLTKTISSGSADILWDNSNSNLSERDGYYHTAYAHMMDKRIDTKLLKLDDHLNVFVNINSTCNAYYSPRDTSINFYSAGGGCSNTGEIADVVFHEFGHRVTHVRYSQAAGGDSDIVDGSLGEGFADLNSAFILDDPRIGITFFGNTKELLRNCDNKRKWPQDIDPDIHIDGEIISGAFWDLRKTIGHDLAQHLFHFMEYQRPDGTGNVDAASLDDAYANTLIATIITDDDDNNLGNGTPHLNQILDAFKLHNITLSKFLTIELAKIEDQDTAALSYPVKVTASYTGFIGTLDQKTVNIHYSVDNGATYKIITLTPSGNDEFTGAIPKAAPGTIVKYYASAATTLAENDTATFPSPSSPYSFLVGYKQVFKDDAEEDRGWSLKSSDDEATTGLWVRDDPYGTYSNTDPPIFFIQQDTDHTLNGTMCYITGNRNKATKNRNPGFDDVDSGATTLTTPALDLSAMKSPYIRYWYYYSNDQGSNAEVPKWEVSISDNNGSTWKSLHSTNISTDGWTEFAFRVADYLQPTSTTKIRFVASDFVGAIVEAGVDDLEIYDVGQPESSVRQTHNEATLPFPNPIHRGEKLYLSMNDVPNISLSLIDLLGRVTAHVDLRDGTFTIPANITPGIYYIQTATERFKIVIEE